MQHNKQQNGSSTVNTVLTNEDRVEQLESFSKRFERETFERHVRMTWHLSLFHFTDGVAELPYSVNYNSHDVTQYEPYPQKRVEASWHEDGFYMTDDYSVKRGVDIEATNKLVAKIIKHAKELGHGIAKKYDDNEFVIKITLAKPDENSYNDVVVNYRVSRKTVCEKVVTIVHHEAEVIEKEAYDEEVVTWDCAKVSFLAMNDAEDKTKPEPTEDFDPPESE